MTGRLGRWLVGPLVRRRQRRQDSALRFALGLYRRGATVPMLADCLGWPVETACDALTRLVNAGAVDARWTVRGLTYTSVTAQTYPCEACGDPLPSLLSSCPRRECLAETTAADRREQLLIEASND